MASPDRKESGADVVELFPTAALPSRINPKGIKDAVEGLRDSLRGSIHEGGKVAELQRLLERLLWDIANSDDSTNATLALAVALDELDELLSQPTTTVGIGEREAFADETATTRLALDVVRGELHEAQEALSQERMEAERLRHDLATERAAREAAEQTSLDELRRALAALREEHAGAAHAIASLKDLAARAGTVHTAIGEALHATTATVRAHATSDLTAERTALDDARRDREAFIAHTHEQISEATEEISGLDEELPTLDAKIRVGPHDVGAQRDRAVSIARRAQLQDHIADLRERMKPVARELEALARRIEAIDSIAGGTPTLTVIPEIPSYPDPPNPDEIPIPSDDGTPDGGGADDAIVSPLPIHLAIVLYELVRQRIGAERRTVLWVAKSAEVAGILARHDMEYWSFTRPVLSGANKELLDPYLKYKGSPGGQMNTLYVRTAEPIPSEWEQLVTDEERERFITAFQQRIDERAEAVAAKKVAKAAKAT